MVVLPVSALELILDDVRGHGADGTAQQRPQLPLAELVSEEPARAAAQQRGAEPALAVLCCAAVRPVWSIAVVLLRVRIGRVRAREGRRGAGPGIRRPGVGVGGPGTRVLRLLWVGR